MAGGSELQDLDLEVQVPRLGRDAVRGAHHAVALGAGDGQAVDGEHDPLGLEDVGEDHGPPRQHALIGAGPGLAGGRLWRCFLLAGGGPGRLVQMLFSSFFGLDLDFFLGTGAVLLQDPPPIMVARSKGVSSRFQCHLQFHISLRRPERLSAMDAGGFRQRVQTHRSRSMAQSRGTTDRQEWLGN